MPEQGKMTIDVEKVRMAIRVGIPISITTYTLPKEMEAFMNDTLFVFLSELEQEHMTEFLSYSLNELTTNAKKANTKRIYFKEKKLDLLNPADYEEGMKNFKNDTLSNINYYLHLQKEAGLYIKLILQMRNGKIKIEVRNNAELLPTEYKRMHEKLRLAQQYTAIEQAFEQVLDDSEGAGLGLIIMILMLEKIGLTKENFQIFCENGETITRIILPLNEKMQNDISVMSRECIKIIDSLPQFPETIRKVTALIADPDVKMSEIAACISSDVALSTDLLKLVNSAQFALASPCSSIGDAVKMVGLHGIKNLVYAAGSINELKNVSSADQKEQWTHAYKVAFYAYNLARNFCAGEREVIEDCYVCGLLHDMGKLMFEAARPNLSAHIKQLSVEKGISEDHFKKLTTGVNHSELGALIAEKWNFPEQISAVIRHHHEPDVAPKNIRMLTSLIYLSDMMVHYETGEVDFYQFDPDILLQFRITAEEQMKKIVERLSKAFAAQ